MTISPHLIAAIIATSAGALLAGCDKLNDPSKTGKADDATQVAAADQRMAGGGVLSQNVSDGAIAASVKAELAKDAELSALRVSVESNRGMVSLRGMAPDAAAKEKATQIASAVKGVASVDNQMAVTVTQ